MKLIRCNNSLFKAIAILTDEQAELYKKELDAYGYVEVMFDVSENLEKLINKIEKTQRKFEFFNFKISVFTIGEVYNEG